jgi:hypothetical protein
MAKNAWSSFKVGREDALYAHREKEQSNFFGDRFTFTIDEVDAAGKSMEKLAGAVVQAASTNTCTT